jgi:hypothetical protein
MYVKGAYVVMVCLLEVLTFCLMVLIVVFCCGAHLIISTSSVDGTYYIFRGAHVVCLMAFCYCVHGELIAYLKATL